jgi:hypothetical protein
MFNPVSGLRPHRRCGGLACAEVPLAQPEGFALDAAGKGCNTAGNAGPATGPGPVQKSGGNVHEQ